MRPKLASKQKNSALTSNLHKHEQKFDVFLAIKKRIESRMHTLIV